MDAEQVGTFAKDLCEILTKPRMNKTDLFGKIFEIFEYDAHHEFAGEFWKSVATRQCNTNTVAGLLTNKLYTKSKWLYDSAKDQYLQQDMASLLFLDLLLHLVEQLRKKCKYKITFLDKITFLENFSSLVGKSDEATILNVSIDNLEYFMLTTPDNTYKIKRTIRDINYAFIKLEQPRSGNYSLNHVCTSFCRGLINQYYRRDVDNDEFNRLFEIEQTLLENPSQENMPPNIRLITPDELENITTKSKGPIYIGQQGPKRQLHTSQLLAELHDERYNTASNRYMTHEGQPVTSVRGEYKPICPFDPVCYQRAASHNAHFRHPSRETRLPDGGKAADGGRKRRTTKNKHHRHRPSTRRTTRRRISSNRRTRRHATHTRRN